jgi:hypothetical protein
MLIHINLNVDETGMLTGEVPGIGGAVVTGFDYDQVVREAKIMALHVAAEELALKPELTHPGSVSFIMHLSPALTKSLSKPVIIKKGSGADLPTLPEDAVEVKPG